MAGSMQGRAAGVPVNINANDVVALAVEIAAFLLLARWGWSLGSSLAIHVVGTVVVAGGAAVLWGLFASPKARFDSLPLAIVTKAIVLGASVVAAAVLLPGWLAGLYAALLVVNTVLIYVGPLARPRAIPDDSGAGST